MASIVEAGCIEADGRRIKRGGGQTSIGMTEIKRRRLFEIDVSCHKGTKVGDYVPFYFCPRSIMLFIIHKDNHPDMSYHGGQRPILHLQVDMTAAVNWANANGILWAFSDRNAGSYIAAFYNSQAALERINWNAVASTDFRDPLVKEGKQAEFLLHDVCPWHLVEKIGVLNSNVQNKVNTVLRKVEHKPIVTIEGAWYY